MEHQIRLVGLARDVAGTECVPCTLPSDATVATLRQELAQQCPPLAELLSSCAIAIDYHYQSDNTPVGKEVTEIAVIPPVSGG